ncbi:hypothetical protein [Haladaptatus halobius]|nr:hypothetical protein [Haladaptatus halobius]
MVNSAIKRSIRETIDARSWFRQVRELVLVASVYNINRVIQS